MHCHCFDLMSSFFAKLKPSKLSKKKPQDGLYSASNSSSQVSLSAKSFSSQQQRFPPSQSASNLSAIASNKSSPTQATQPLFMKPQFVKSALVKGSFQTIVDVPKYVDINEWLALNVFEFNSHIQQFVFLLSDYIDQSHTMSAGAGYDYLWIDVNKQTVILPASTYIEYTLSWITSKFDDTSLFPTRQGVPFPPNFIQMLRSIYNQLFRIFAYLYHNQFERIVHLGLEPHFNSLFCHFISFGKHFDLIDKNELVPLQQLVFSFEQQGKIA